MTAITGQGAKTGDARRVGDAAPAVDRTQLRDP